MFCENTSAPQAFPHWKAFEMDKYNEDEKDVIMIFNPFRTN